MAERYRAPATGPDSHIDVFDTEALRQWSMKLGVTPDRLKVAVRAVGPNARRVEDFLRGGGRNW
jgi:Protein of unknown function (DUF3606)